MITVVYGPDSLGQYHTQRLNPGDAIPSTMFWAGEILKLVSWS